MDIVGFPVDSFAAKFVLCTKTKVGLATQGNHSIPGKFGLKQIRRPLVVGSGVSSRGNQFFFSIWKRYCISDVITSAKLVADKAIYAESVSMLQYWTSERSTNTSMKKT